MKKILASLVGFIASLFAGSKSQANPRKQAVILVDWDNCDTPKGGWQQVKQLVLETSDIVLASVFADVNQITLKSQTELHFAGFQIVHCPKKVDGAPNEKDCVDHVMTAFMAKVVPSMQIDEVYLFSMDRDFSTGVNCLRDAGLRVRLVTSAKAAVSCLSRAADDVVVVDFLTKRAKASLPKSTKVNKTASKPVSTSQVKAKLQKVPADRMHEVRSAIMYVTLRLIERGKPEFRPGLVIREATLAARYFDEKAVQAVYDNMRIQKVFVKATSGIKGKWQLNDITSRLAA